MIKSHFVTSLDFWKFSNEEQHSFLTDHCEASSNFHLLEHPELSQLKETLVFLTTFHQCHLFLLNL